jgi:hypothetical protein
MSRPALVWIACTVASLGAGGGVAHATGPGPAPPPPPCSFTLSAPVRDGDTVTATVVSTGCAALAVPYSAVACLNPDGGAATRCEQAHGADPARVSVPYTPGVTFVATGRGCAGWNGLSPAPDCQLLGPNSATL